MKFSYYQKIIVFLFLLFSKSLLSQDSIISQIKIYDNSILDSNIHTVIICKQGVEYSVPLLNINSQDKLTLRFDNLNDNVINYKISFTHCNADWTKSPLSIMDFQTGYETDDIKQYTTSFNTTQSYVNYEYSFPNDNVQLTKSGNYIINVYDEDNNIVVMARFYAIETTPLTIIAEAKRATKIEYMNNRQEIDFSINTNGYYIDNPYENIQTIITQNNRTDNAIKNLKPKFVRANEYIYDYEEENTFTADNEYRYLDLRSSKFGDLKIKNMVYEFKQYHVLMNTEERRSYKRFFSTPDINGNFIIHKYDATNHNSEADYMNVTFVLQYDAPLLDGDLYVFGGFNNNQFNANNKMQYDYTDKTYKSTLYLKQGYYNYNYVFLPKDKTAGEAWFIEGMHWEAENDYNIFVYYRDIINQYDKLIGFTGINSIKK